MADPPPRRWLNASAVVGGVLLGLVAVGAVVFAQDPVGSPLQAVDERWREAMLATRTGAATQLAYALNVLGGAAVTITVTSVLAAYWLARRAWALAFFVFAATVSTRIVTNLLKLLVGRPRPPDPLVDVGGYAYPSGHVSAATALAMVATLILGRRWLGAVLVAVAAVAMIWDRTYLSVHWLSDTLAGACLGVGLPLLCWLAFVPRLTDHRGVPE